MSCHIFNPFFIKIFPILKKKSAKIFVSIFIVSNQSFSLWSQSESHVLFFRGGQLNLSAQLGWIQNDWVTFSSDNQSGDRLIFCSQNPALLGLSTGHFVQFKGSLPLSVNIAPLLDLNGQTENTVTASLEPYKLPQTEIESPSTKLDLQTVSPLELFSLFCQWGQFHCKFSYHRDLQLSTNVLFSGFETRASTPMESGGTDSEVVFNGRLNGQHRLGIQSHAFDLSVACPVSSNLFIGVQARRISFLFETAGRAIIDASMIYNGQEYLFNDPNALWPTDLTQSIDARFQGSGWIFRLGMLHCTSSEWKVDAMMESGIGIRCTGHMHMVQNSIPALNADALIEDNEDEILDATKLKLSQLTYTEPIGNLEYDKIRLGVPFEVGLGVTHLKTNGSYRFTIKTSLNDLFVQYGTARLNFNSKTQIRFQTNIRQFYTVLGLQYLRVDSNRPSKYIDLSRTLVVPEWMLGIHVARKQWHWIPTLDILPVPGIWMNMYLTL